jgi:hypothetical protein
MALTPNANALLKTVVRLPSENRDAASTSAAPRESELSATIRVVLRRALTAKYFAILGADSQLHADLRLICRDAKRQNMRVEYLIIALKDAWRALPEARTLPQGSQGQELLSRIISLCIAEFYATACDE